MREAIMPRKVGRACGKIILSGNTANRFGKRALAVPVDMYITAAWDNSDNRRRLDEHCPEDLRVNRSPNRARLGQAYYP